MLLDTPVHSAPKKKKPFSSVLVCTALTAEYCVITDYILMFSAIYLPMKRFFLVCIGGLLASVLLVLISRKIAGRLLIIVTAVSCMVCVYLQLFYIRSQNDDFLEKLAYHETDSEKGTFFSNKKVLLFVPHQDDDLNVFCGVLDEYLRYGSDLTIAFMTNGDCYGLGEVRIQEALALYDYLGVPEDHVIFLGYGDSLHTEQYHIYNAPPDELIISHVGKSETYGIETHSPFREERAYTYENLYADIKDMILSVRPDVIFCVDYDSHMDHKACSMLFEKALGDILRTESAYSPEVYKGFAYSTSWNAEHDFFSVNIKATHDIYHNSMIVQTPPIYPWKERVRFPVRAGTLSRSLQASAQYGELQFYRSQGEETHGAAIINGDRVFWKRSTHSVCRDATLSASSGNPMCLNDFMLLDSREILNQNHDPFDGLWSPEGNDSIKTVDVQLNAPYDICEIVLYDNADTNSNILNAVIEFDNGSVIETGPLDAFGAPSRIKVDIGEDVTAFRIVLTTTEGDRPGLMEIEAFCENQEPKAGFMKIMDINGNFAYDYIIDNSGKQSFLIYSDGIIPELSSEDYEVECDNASGCEAEIHDGLLHIYCEKGQSSMVRIELKESGMADSIFIQNPTLFNRIAIALAQKLELIRTEDYELLHISQLKKCRT